MSLPKTDFFSEKRDRVFNKAIERGLAKPIAYLLAAVWEPRSTKDPSSKEFDKAVEEQRQHLRSALGSLKTSQGGAAEISARQACRILLEKAHQLELKDAATILQQALSRCEHPQTPKTKPLTNSPQIPEIQPIEGPSGRPIGLWR